eukprot:1188281-Prorocentrum_minimum.AAC.2
MNVAGLRRSWLDLNRSESIRRQGKREYTHNGHQSRQGRENIPTSGTNRVRGERKWLGEEGDAGRGGLQGTGPRAGQLGGPASRGLGWEGLWTPHTADTHSTLGHGHGLPSAVCININRRGMSINQRVITVNRRVINIHQSRVVNIYRRVSTYASLRVSRDLLGSYILKSGGG